VTDVTALSASSATASFVSHDRRVTTRHRLGTPWHWSLASIGVIALALTAWGVGGSMSDYYASIALSMSRSWPNFFFGAFDPAGTVTLDKIPGSFWIPALTVRVFGFSPAAVILPNAVAAAGAAVITAVTARRWAGRTAGIVAGAVVATTPILVAVARSNQPETFFVLALALTAWAATHALRRASFGWLLLTGVFIAAAFQTYMLEAWAVWPALAAAYLTCTRIPWWRRAWQLAAAGAVSLALSVAWIVAVSLVPASARPYVGSTLSNNPWEMVFGYNGLGRFGDTTADTEAYRSFTPPFAGGPSALRLLNAALADQIGWVIPLTIAAIAVLVVLRFRRPLVVFGAVWFTTFAVMFSAVAGMHQFYTASLAVPMGLLIGAAFGWARRRRALWAQIALVSTAVVTAIGISIGVASERGAEFSLPVAAVQFVVASAAVALLIRDHRRRRASALAAALAVAGMLLTPASWAVATVWSPNATNPTAAGVASDSGLPGMGGFAGGGAPRGASAAGPGQGSGSSHPFGAGSSGSSRNGGASHRNAVEGDAAAGGRTATGGFGQPGSGTTVASIPAVAWLTEHQQGTTYLAATFGAQSAATLILASDGGSFLPIGGFNQQDPVPTLADFQLMVARGELRYVITGGGGGFAGGGGFGSGGSFGGQDAATTSAGQIRTWVLANCTAVTDAPITGLYACEP